MTFPINYLKYLISPSPSILKPPKVIPIHKKDSKLDFSNYHPISLLSNINFFLKGQCTIECTNSSLTMILSIPYSLALDKNIQRFMLLLALQKILEKTQMKEMLAVTFLLTFRKHLIPLNMILFYQSLNITHSVHCQGIIKDKMEVGIQFWVPNFDLSPKYPMLLFRNELASWLGTIQKKKNLGGQLLF